MVKGLELFEKHFAPYEDKYVLIGGTACMIVMQDAGLEFRATKDLDIVLHVEALDIEFVKAFWEFIRAGGYQNRQRSTGKEVFYRFYSPSNTDFPAMLELFSRIPDTVKLEDGSHLTPIPVNEAAISLSAILLNDDYYHFIHSGKRKTSGLSIVDAAHLIPLKARAWIDLDARKAIGEAVDEKDIRKHKNDILRLYQLLASTLRIITPQSILNDMQLFLERLEKDSSIDLKNLGLKQTSIQEITGNLRKIYGCDLIHPL
jgi:hypothetical protein